VGVCAPAIVPSPGSQTLRAKGTNCAPLGFAEYVPANYASQATWPMIVFFHGRGEMGNGSATALAKLITAGLAKEVQNSSWDPQKRFIVLSVNYDWGDLNATTLKNFMAFAKANYKVDLKRIYLTGLSQGGDPMYIYLSATNGADIAAAVPISAVTGNSSQDLQNNPRQNECAFRNVPFWLFHGSADNIVGPGGSLDIYTKLGKCSPASPVLPRYTEYTGVGHDAWTRTYDRSGMNSAVQTGRQAYDISIYDWLLQHSKP
jgi:predicted peptidase